MDKNNQISNEINTENKNNFVLPPGCMITKREIQPISSLESATQPIGSLKSKNKKGIGDKIIVGMVVMGVIACLLLGGMYLLPKLKGINKDKTTENMVENNNTTVSENEEYDVNTDTNANEYEDNTEATETIPIHSVQAEKDEEASDTDANGTTENTTENEYSEIVDDTVDGIIIGGLVVKYGFDDTWEATIENGKYKARKNVESDYVSLAVEDSNININNEAECLEYLSNVENPFETNGQLKESEVKSEIMLNGRVCYFTSYTGISADGNTYTLIGIMQDFGGDTYAFILIEDTIGYSVENLIQSLCINLEEN